MPSQRQGWIVAFFLLLKFVTVTASTSWRLKIALHAQALPTKDKVVGSVLTTDGLKNAFLKRSDVEAAEVFYPSHYKGFVAQQWDFILIEGWFPSIHRFILLSRNNFPDTKILFFCLDPTYPGLDTVRTFDIDGLLTNSHRVVEEMRDLFPVKYVMLAADTDEMRPLPNMTRSHAAVYVGAGGNMLSAKSGLYQMLLDSLPYGLLLHGSSWNEVPVLRDISQGPLPRHALADAYASADAVLASTISSQSAYGMINNRIFEALSCGAIIISEYSQALEDLISKESIDSNRPPLILFVNSSHTVAAHYEFMKGMHVDVLNNWRRRARHFILEKHTWDHRAVQIIEFYSQLLKPSHYALAHDEAIFTGKRCSSLSARHCPALLWVVSSDLKEHLDYIHIEQAFLSESPLGDQYHVHLMRDWSVEEWNQMDLSIFDTIISVMRVGDALSEAINNRLTMRSSRTGNMQKIGCYLFGTESIQPHHAHINNCDLIWFRSQYELQQLSAMKIVNLIELDLRLQHGFGVMLRSINSQLQVAASETITTTVHNDIDEHRTSSLVLIVCYFHSYDRCTIDHRNMMMRRAAVDGIMKIILLLCGGSWEEWLQTNIIFNTTDRSNSITVKMMAGYIGNDVMLLFRMAHSVIFMNEVSPNQSKQEPIWPFITAAVAGARIYLFEPAPHLLHLAANGCDEWDYEYLRGTVVKVGLDRLEGFGSRHSEVKIRVLLPILTSTEAKRITCEGCDEDDSLILMHYFAPVLESTSNEVLAATLLSTALLRLDYKHFDIGVDGECCINQIDADHIDSMCLMRGFQYVAIIFQHSDHNMKGASTSDAVGRSACSAELSLEIFLRGNFYSDSIYSTNITVPIRKYPKVEDVPFRGNVYENDVIHTFDAYVCDPAALSES